MRNSFKNFRRDHPDDERPKRAGGASLNLAPPSKRHKTPADFEDDELSEEEYKQAIEDLKTEWKKGRSGRSQTKLKKLMDQTHKARRQWIMNEKPMVHDIVKKFPPLKHSRFVSIIFRLVFGYGQRDKMHSHYFLLHSFLINALLSTTKISHPLKVFHLELYSVFIIFQLCNSTRWTPDQRSAVHFNTGFSPSSFGTECLYNAPRKTETCQFSIQF